MFQTFCFCRKVDLLNIEEYFLLFSGKAYNHLTAGNSQNTDFIKSFLIHSWPALIRVNSDLLISIQFVSIAVLSMQDKKGQNWSNKLGSPTRFELG